MAFNWNKQQLDAIEFRGKNLLLSAAAGSGKTATLTERIIRLLKDPSAGAEISRMLIVTFTNDAAAELKTRISAAITEAIAKDPSNKRLVRQLRDLEGASISTTHSFLLSELKPYFVRFDLPPDFTVCEEAAIEQMKREIMADTVNDFFEGECECANFKELADTLSGARDDETLDEAMLELWDDLMKLGLEPQFLSRPQPDEDFLTSGIGCAVAARMKMVADHYFKVFTNFERELSLYEPLLKNAEGAGKTAEIATALGQVADMGYDAAKKFITEVQLPAASKVSSKDSNLEYENYKQAKTDFKKDLTSLKDNYFSVSDELMAETKEKLSLVSQAAGRILSEFDKRFSSAKRERGKVDFNDIERLSAKLFCDENGEATPEALAVSQKYDYVFIDEYQDTNRLQDMIYTAISTCANRFMVGDVKQSIYRFRGACPEIFVKYREKYETTDEGTAIFMSENHRSDSGVIDFSNLISDYMFPASETPFEEEDRLVCAKENGLDGESCEICIVEEGEGAGEDFEADFVARKIEHILKNDTLKNGEPVMAKDIAILLRTGKTATAFKKAMEKRGIPVKNSAADSFFNYSETLLLTALLFAVDNPTRDIYLTAAMKSPLFGFTMDDLVMLRGKDKNPLWYSVNKYADNNEDTLAIRLRAFRDKLNYYRQASRSMLCDKFLYMLITDTGFNALTDESGNGRLLRSVRRMYSHAVSCADSGGGLHDFIIYLKGLMSKNDDKAAASEANAVTIITIHRSKGLEYPICFLCDTTREFSLKDSKKSAILDGEYGMFTKLSDSDGLIRCNNPYRNAALYRQKLKNREEDMRVLYVAMTRAKEKLIVTLKSDNADETLERSRQRISAGATDYAVTNVSSAAMWILDGAMSNIGHPSFKLEKHVETGEDDHVSEETVTLDEENIARICESLKNKFSFTYEGAHLSSIPAKLSVSKLSSNVLDGSYSERKNLPPAPSFLSGKRKATAAEKGTATHNYLQFCDFEGLSKNAVAEAERLCRKKFITEETKDLIRFDELETFAKSPLFERISTATEIYREIRFNSMLKAAQFTENEELKAKLLADNTDICVQGVVDCLFTDKNGKTVLVDYKTDRLTEEELSDRAKAEEKLRSRHSDQLLTYKKLCADILGRPIDEVLIYSLALGDAIELT